MSRGRPRLLDDTMPTGVDPRRLPKRCYWDGRDRVWYTIHSDPKPRRQRIADSKATLAELHAIMEAIAGVERGSLGYVLDQFHQSAKFANLAPSTRAGYDKQRLIAKSHKTKLGLLGTLSVARMSVPMMQVLFDSIGAKTPTKANQLLRYLRRALAWGMQRGHCLHNPCRGVGQAKERRLRRLPSIAAYAALLALARAGGARKAHSTGSCAPYLWMIMEIGVLCLLRPIETLTLTDADILADGVQTNRRKGSRDTLFTWTPRLRAAIDAAIALRKRETVGRPVPLRPEDRVLFVGQDGAALSKSGLDTAWQRLIQSAIKTGVITAEQRFGLHDLKRKGITDTPGTRGEKQLASGHKAEAMLDTYDQSIPAVKPAGE